MIALILLPARRKRPELAFESKLQAWLGAVEVASGNEVCVDR